MREITLDEYYLTEQDEPTVRQSVAVLGLTVVAASSAGKGGRRSAMRRRLRALRRAASLALHP